MDTIQTDQDVDQLIWSIIADSRNPHDFVAYCRHAVDRDAGHDLAMRQAQRYWFADPAPALFPKAVAMLEAMAEQGATAAMFHLARWYRMGYGVEMNSQLGLDWYRRGMEAGDVRCLVNMARNTALTDPQAAALMFQQAVDQGYPNAHCFWADSDKENKEQHLRLAAEQGSAYAMFTYASYLLSERSADERDEHMQWMRRAAEGGDGSACLRMAYEYMYPPRGGKADNEAAELWLRKGVRLGDMGCVGLLGRHLMGTYDDPQDEGLMYLQRACTLGDTIAQSTLGFQMLWWGKTQEDQTIGLGWLRAAAEEDHKLAIFRLGEAYEKARGTAENIEEAAKWYTRGVELGHADCQAALGALHLSHQIAVQDPARAHELFQMSSLQGNMWGVYLLGSSYALGYGVKKNEKAAVECFLRGAEDDDARCTFRLGHAYLFGIGVAKNVGTAIKWLRASAREGFSEASLYLGLILLYDDDLETNHVEAARWLRKAADANDARALRELGLLYAKGLGVTEDAAEAQRLMARSAAQGDKEAQEWLDANCPQKPDWLQKLVGENS